jgi:chromosome segregation ATPase
MSDYLLPLITFITGAGGSKLVDWVFRWKNKKLEMDGDEKERLWSRIGNLEGKLEKVELQNDALQKEYMTLFKEHVRLQATHEQTLLLLDKTTSALNETREALDRATKELHDVKTKLNSYEDSSHSQ